MFPEEAVSHDYDTSSQVARTGIDYGVSLDSASAHLHQLLRDIRMTEVGKRNRLTQTRERFNLMI